MRKERRSPSLKLASLFEQAQITYCPPGKPVLNSVLHITTPLEVYEDYDDDHTWSTEITGPYRLVSFIIDNYDHEYDEHNYDTCDEYEHCDYVGLSPINDNDTIVWSYKDYLTMTLKKTNLILTWKEVIQ